MITIDSTSESLWSDVLHLISDQLPSILEGGLLVRVNGIFSASDKQMILTKVSLLALKARQCEIYRSGVEEFNRLEILLSKR